MANTFAGRLLILFLLMFSGGMANDTTPADSDPGWIVYADFAIVREQPASSAPVVTRLPKGALVHGEYYRDETSDEEWLIAEIDGIRCYVPRWNLNRVHPENQKSGNLPIGEERVDRWWGVPIEYEPNDLAVLPERYRWEKVREYQLRREAMQALTEMLEAAKKDGISLLVNSAYRSGVYQKGLYERAVSKDGAKQRYSAPPGHSEHQLGTCVDLTDAAGRFAFSAVLDQQPEGKWLERNAWRFGFKRSYYPHNVKDTGYISEPWHWRYWGKERLALEQERSQDRAAGK